MGHMRGCDCIRTIALTSGLKKPHLITSTMLRKYMATVAQVFMHFLKKKKKKVFILNKLLISHLVIC